MQQSKILNCVYPFSKASSLNENRRSSQRLKQKQVESIISHIKTMYQAKSDGHKSVWEELYDFETNEAVDILKKCGVQEGMTVLDMGCGYAHYTIPASIAAGKSGQVIAADMSKKVIKDAQNRVNNLNINNAFFINANEIERKPDHTEKMTDRGSFSTKHITYEEAIKSYITLIESCGFTLKNVVENSGVHFDDFHSPYHWRKYGEVRISSLERRHIYNFVKV